MNTRQTILVSIAILLVCALAVWWYLGFSLDFMRFFAADPGVTNVEVSQSPAPASPSTQPAAVSSVVSCAPETQTVKVGVAAQITGSGGNGQYEWFAPMGTPDTGTAANFSVTYDSVGTKQITVQSARGDSLGSVDSVQCSIVVTP